MNKPGLYANIHAKRERIRQGSGERMRQPDAPGAPTAEAFKQSAKTAGPPAATSPGRPGGPIRNTGPANTGLIRGAMK